MDSNSMMFLLILMVGGGLTVTLFYYGAQFLLRFLEMPDAVRIQGDGPTTAVDTAASLHASALKPVVSVAPPLPAPRV